MFIREKIKKVKGEKSYIQHQLIESVRTLSGPRQHIVLNLGQLDIDRDKWKALANAIEAFVNNQKLLFALDSEVEAKARHYAELLRQERLAEKGNVAKIPQDVCYETVDVKSVANHSSRTIGAEHVAFSQMEEYKFAAVLSDLGFSASQILYAQMLIVARMVHPASERETARWINNNSALIELLGAEELKIYDMALHRVAVMLWENHVEIEKRLSQKACELFSLKETILLYDLTNTYFEGSKRKSEIAKFGKSKERRNDCPLMTLALTVDDQGFPKESKILAGNISESGTLGDILKGLSQSESEKTIVIDAGIATEDNLELINDFGIKYVASSRRRKYPDSFWDSADAKEVLLSDEKTKLKLKQVRIEDEVFVLCCSEHKAKRDADILTAKMQKFEKELTSLNESLQKKGARKKYDYILERIGRIKERYRVDSLYTVKVKKEAEKAVKVSFTKTKDAEKKVIAFGQYVLRTNRVDLSSDEISRIHRSLTTVESSFEQMKGSLGLRPNFHKQDEPTIAHANITVLAYHFLAGILEKSRMGGINYTWGTIRNILASHTRVTTSANTKDGYVINIRNCTSPSEEQTILYSKLGIKKMPLPQIMLKTPLKANKQCSAENKY